MKTVKIPTLAELSPKLADLHAKRLALANEAAPLRAEQFELSRAQPQPEPTSDQGARIAALLGRSAPHRESSDLERLRTIDSRLRDIDAALEVLGAEISAEKSIASAKAQELLEPEFRDRRHAVCEALIGAHTADFRLRTLVEDIESMGLSTGLMPQSFPFRLDAPNDPHGWIGLYLEEARRAGIIGRSQIPAELSHQ